MKRILDLISLLISQILLRKNRHHHLKYIHILLPVNERFQQMRISLMRYEELIMKKKEWHKATVVKKDKLNEKTCTLFLKTEQENSFTFIPGQFITLDLPIAERCIKRWRSYSIASAPSDACDEYDIELCISRHQSGKGSKYLCDEVQEGDELTYKGPAGCFTLDVKEDKSVVMICSETGIAPCRSILRALKDNSLLPKKIELIHNVNKEEELLYRSEFCSLMKTMPNFRYSAMVSDNKFFIGCNGKAPVEYCDKFKDHEENIEFFICGWPDMVNETINCLIHDKGFDKDQVFYEIYR